jgi:Concanavalin A-like lectin/glucanases superfamily/FG-GAP-like repeat
VPVVTLTSSSNHCVQVRRNGRIAFAFLFVFFLIASADAMAQELKDFHNVRREGGVANVNFDLDGIDDYRVDADIAMLNKWGKGDDETGYNTVHYVNCTHPNPWAESQETYIPPDPEDPNWEADELLNEIAPSPYGSYGCLDNDAPELNSRPDGIRGVEIDGTDGLGGMAPGARIWRVRVLQTITPNFGTSPDPENYPLTVSGSGVGPLSTPIAPVECGQSRFETTLGLMNLLSRSFDAEYAECASLGRVVTVETNSCQYAISILNAGPPYEGTLGISCEEAGDAIEIDIEEEGEAVCTERLLPQSGLTGVSLSNEKTGSERVIDVDIAVDGVKYELLGSCGGKSGLFSDGEIDGETTLSGENPGGDPRGFFISGKESEEKAEGPVQPLFNGEIGWLPELSAARISAGLNWIARKREDEDPTNDIEVVYFQIGCVRVGTPAKYPDRFESFPECPDTLLSEAIARVVDSGVVVVAASGNTGLDASLSTPQAIPDTLTATATRDTDGMAGGVGGADPCAGIYPDDQRVIISSHGPAVDITATLPCGDSGGTSSKVAGAAAAFASQCPAHDRAGAEFIVDTLMAEGDTGEAAEGGWFDDSGDVWKEPLLNLYDEDIFDPVLLASPSNPEGEDEEPSPEGCEWHSHQAESDVDSDGRADLVAAGGNGERAKVLAGSYEGPAEDPKQSGFATTNPTSSLLGQLDPALRDGKGTYTIDSADVNGDRHADLVTATSGEGIYVYPGNAQGGFGAAVKSLSGTTLAFADQAGELEPIAVADVDGDERADLIAHSEGDILTYPGKVDGSFAEAIDSSLSIDSALHDREGAYFLDVIDVTGEELDDPEAEPIDYNLRHSNADLVVSDTDGTVYVHPGDGEGEFGAAIEAAELDPILDDGTGEEPVGLGDVDRDRRADLLTLDGETLKLYRATDDGSFAEPTTAYEGEVDSSLTDGSGEELIGLLDYSRDGLADLVSLNSEGELLTYTAQRDFSFEAPRGQGGTLSSQQSSPTGHEFAAQKPLARRAGCLPNGCDWSVHTFAAQAPPIAAYSFDEGAGATLSDSAGNHNGTIEGATWTTGKYGKALDFDGTNDLVSIADANELDLTGPFTIEAWVAPDTNNRPVLSKGTPGYKLAMMEVNGAPSIPHGYIATTKTAVRVDGPSSIPTASWSHLAFTSDGETMRFYQDGELVATKALTITPEASAAALQIGRSYYGGLFDGRIDEVRLYGAALSEGQIEADRDTPVGIHQMPVAAYSFNEGTGSTLADSARAHDGTIEGATWSAGKYGSALEFDGKDDLVDIADAADLRFTNAFTLEAWVRPDTNAGGSLISKSEAIGGLPNLTGFWLNAGYGGTEGKPAGLIAKAGTTYKVKGPSALSTAGVWAHLAVSYDGEKLRLYKDGELIATETAPAPSSTTASLRLGISLVGKFDGRMDEVRLYGEPLPQSQIQADRDSPIDPTPIAAYSFEEGEGTVLGDSAESHDGTIEGATWSGAGKYGSALDFDGVNDGVKVADANELDLTGPYTIEAWLRPTHKLEKGIAIAKLGSVSGKLAGYVLATNNGEVAGASTFNAGTQSKALAPEAAPAETWTHLAVSFDGTNQRLYMNGALVATAASLAPQATTAGLNIGRSGLGAFFDGMIDEVRIYDVPLSGGQIAAGM